MFLGPIHTYGASSHFQLVQHNFQVVEGKGVKTSFMETVTHWGQYSFSPSMSWFPLELFFREENYFVWKYADTNRFVNTYIEHIALYSNKPRTISTHFYLNLGLSGKPVHVCSQSHIYQEQKQRDKNRLDHPWHCQSWLIQCGLLILRSRVHRQSSKCLSPVRSVLGIIGHKKCPHLTSWGGQGSASMSFEFSLKNSAARGTDDHFRWLVWMQFNEPKTFSFSRHTTHARGVAQLFMAHGRNSTQRVTRAVSPLGGSV